MGVFKGGGGTGRKREKEEREKWRRRGRRKRKMEASQRSGGKDASVLVEQLPLCWHSITSLKNVNNQHYVQHRPVTCKHPSEA